jgi:ubiquinone/menaquinone biosynthesis C-methylase UbiE
MENFWSDYIQTSEELYTSRSLRFREDNKQLWLSAMKLVDGMDVLEIGCGGGIFCHRIKTFLPRCRVTGIDCDAGHILYAERKSQQLGIDCHFLEGDALHMPFINNAFDACTSFTVIEHVETARFLAEQYRVLRPGGVISVLSVRMRSGFVSAERLPASDEEQALVKKAWEGSEGFDKTHGIGQYEMKEDDFPKALETAGFADVNVEFFAVTRYAPDNAEVSRELALAQINCERLFALGAVGKALRMKPGALTTTERKRLEELINKRFDNRIALYEQGKKLWDITSSVVLAATGLKPEKR